MKPWTWRHAIIKSKLPPTTRHVLLTLSCHLNDLGEDCFPSTAMLAAETGLSERSVCTHLALAAEQGWFVVRKHGYGKQKWARHEYFPRIPEGFEVPDRDDGGTEGGSVPQKKGRGKKALKEVQCPVDKATEGGSVPSQEALNVVQEGTEPNDIKALKEVQSNTAVNPSLAAADASAENDAAAAAQKTGNGETSPDADEIAPSDAEATMLAWIAALPNCEVDAQADRVHVLTWVGRGVTAAQLADAHRRATGRRKLASDSRPIYAGFLARFVDEVLAASTAADAPVPVEEPWWKSDSGTGAQGKRVRVERRPNESTPDYLIRVAQASGRGPWIDHVLKSWQGSSRYQQIVEFFGAELLPTDFYA
ncbi:helix-turn-helix domain-containing protein [Paraburkholderia nodosa]|uniref:helix-turn-helix domain-containing protein n=1 Tax=Paraburkholderia nodosa TaxID=392320 RepID=UPI00084174E9|nr:helix-turn-helix domain-containing protein [Paraburkholderia nodosa]